MGAISIRAKILAIVLSFFALLGASFVVYSVFTTNNYKQLRLESIKKTVEFETEKVNKKITGIEHGALHFAVSGSICRESQSIEVGENAVLEYLFGFTDAEGGGFWFEPYAYDGETFRVGIYAHYDETYDFYVLDETMYSGGELDIDYYDYHGMSWYREIFDALTEPNQVAWTKPYIDDSGSFSLMTTAGAGIYDNYGNLIGISIIDWKIEDVVKELTAIKPTDNSFALLSAPEQNYIISNTHGDNDASPFSAGARIDSLSWDAGASSLTLDGVSYIAFSRIMDNNWSLSVYIPENEIFEEMETRNNQFTLILALSAAAMLCAAFLLISEFINRPMRRLINGVSSLELGNLDVNIDIGSKDELGSLAGAFNKMTSDLKESIERSARVLAEKEHISAELNVATKIQESMLPCIFPAYPDRPEFDIFASMLPAEEVGGDFYDFFLVNDRTLAVIVADVSDKGIPAALFMVITKTLIKNNALSGKNPKEVLETVNNILCENNEAGMFVTVFLGYLDIPDGTLTFVNAGHNPPLLRANGKYEWLITKPNIMLAVMEDVSYEQHEVILSPDDGLFLYTDGVTEAANTDYDMFGEARLYETVNNHLDLPGREFTTMIKHEIDMFSDGAEQTDDITMLALRYYGHQPSTNELQIEARIENVDHVLDFVDERLADYPQDVRNMIGVAVDEVFSNISHYAYPSTVGNVTIRVDVGDEITLEFEDSGIAFDPFCAPPPDLAPPPEGREIGGLGIFMVKNIVDSIQYRRAEGKNITTLKKGLPL